MDLADFDLEKASEAGVTVSLYHPADAELPKGKRRVLEHDGEEMTVTVRSAAGEKLNRYAFEKAKAMHAEEVARREAEKKGGKVETDTFAVRRKNDVDFAQEALVSCRLYHKGEWIEDASELLASPSYWWLVQQVVEATGETAGFFPSGAKS